MNLDVLIFQQINGLAGRWIYLDALGVFFAEYFQYVLVIILVWLFRKNIRVIFWSLAAAVLARFGITELIRLCWARPRPFVENNEPSFPSGHAAFFFALSAVVYSYNKKAGIIFFFASALISIARVFVGVHWPLDILGGAAVGILAGWIIIKISKKF